VFRNLNDPRVIWVGIENREKLAELSKAIKSGLDKAGITTDEKEFRPHLTLGRIKRIKNKTSLEEVINKHSNHKFQDVRVTEVIFYESILQQSGSLYIPIKTFSLS
jgi:2'-5' RNA ligase